MATSQEILSNFQEYARKSNSHAVRPPNEEEQANYAARLSKSLHYLQKQVSQAETELQERRALGSSMSLDKPAQDARSRIQQLRAITAAYKIQTEAEPLLPSADSPMPALLTLRETLRTVDQLKRSIRECRQSISDAQVRLDQENQNLQLAQQMTAALRDRVEKLEAEKMDMMQRGPEGIATHLWQVQQHKQSQYTIEFKRLVIAFNKFINEYLAVMIAAEDLGGPVVGDDLNLDEDVLRGGFTKQGKAKKIKKLHDKKEDSDEEVDAPGASDRRHEKQAVGAEFRRLTEDLMNAAADEDSSDPYITIPKETAAVRFLVRAKVAEFHPKDARRIRLVDFGATFDDDA